MGGRRLRLTYSASVRRYNNTTHRCAPVPRYHIARTSFSAVASHRFQQVGLAETETSIVMMLSELRLLLLLELHISSRL